ncbi:MAG TPA: hypothetical protein QF499_12085 [Gammaproteobacteria bacterium]|nr:hypothetical protein [Gammaproteobacteria bacterium]
MDNRKLAYKLTKRHSDMKRLGIIGLITIAALSLVANSAAAAEYEVNLVADEFTTTMPDAAVIDMWGFGSAPDATCPPTTAVTVSAPGPVIEVPPGDDLKITVCNLLPASSEPVSVVIAGQAMPTDGAGTLLAPVYFTSGSFNGRVRSFTQEAAPDGGSQTYVWTGIKPGTHLYHSGTHQQVQMQMGLYGAVKQDFATGAAYDGVQYDEEHILFYSEIDKALHDAVNAGNYDPEGSGTMMTSIKDYHADYGLINGTAYPATVPLQVQDPSSWGPPTGPKEILLRFLSASLEDRTPVIQGMYVDFIAQDGFAAPHPSTQYSLRLPAGSTRDGIFTLDCTDSNAHGKHVIYDGRMKLTNAGSGPAGGMRINMHLCNPPPVVDSDSEGLPDDQDNCTNIANSTQIDSNGDGYGNACDADLNNDGIVNFADLGVMRSVFFTDDQDADLNGDGVVNFADVAIIKTQFLGSPGPSAHAE